MRIAVYLDRIRKTEGHLAHALEAVADRHSSDPDLRDPARLLAGLESSGARAEQLAKQMLIYGRPLSTDELMQKVEAVEVADLQALVARMLASPVSLATVGPILHVARFDRVAEKFTVPSSKAA